MDGVRCDTVGPRQEVPAPSPWRDRRFAVFATGNFVNNVGEQIFRVGLPLLVYDLTGSLLVMSMLVVLESAVLLLGPALGAVVDRWGPRVLVVPGLLVQLVAAAALNLFALGEDAPLWPLFVLGAFVALGGSAYRAGWMAGVATMFPDNPVRSRGSLNTLFVLSRVVGPLVVATTLGQLGYLALLWLNTASFLAPIIVWSLGVHPPRAAYQKGRMTMLSDIMEGWRTIRGHPIVIRAELVSLPLHGVASAGTIALAVYYLRSEWQTPARWVSAILMAVNIGALVGVMLVAERRRLRVRRTMAVSAVGMTGLLFGMAVPNLEIFVCCLVLFHVLRQCMATAGLLMIFKYLPARAVGRASGILDLFEAVPELAFPLLIPLLEPGIGAQGTFLLLGAVALTSVLGLIVTWHSWTDTPGQVQRSTS